MYINKIFKSLQGEGIDSGVPATFVRLSGCNLSCPWCDTKYALSEGKEMTVLDVLASLSSSNNVIITGGEPLLQEEEVGMLVKQLRVPVAIETNGTLPLPKWWRKVVWDVDFKCPSAKPNHLFDKSWIAIGRKNRIKFVVSDDNDLLAVKAVLPTFEGPLKPALLISPMIPTVPDSLFGDMLMQHRRWLQKVWDFCVEKGLRYSLQSQKVVWGNRKGI